MARKTKEEALETRNQILDAAERVFAAQGVSQTSLADIANAAGVTRGAIYWHFKNKADVLTAMVERELLPMECLLQAAADGAEHPDPLGSLRKVFIDILRDAVRNPRRRRVLDVMFNKLEFTDEMGAVRQRKRESLREGAAHVQRVLAEAAALGQLPTDLDVERADIMLYGMLSGLLSHWLLYPERFDLEAEAEKLVDGYLDMLRLSPALRR
jgi:TetR/AcrR family acrAB operon transcriptional repressor